MAMREQRDVQADRREFFRLDDSVQLSYRVVSQREMPERLEDLANNIGDSFTVMTRLQAISQHLAAVRHRIEQRDADVADYLKALDQKIDLLGQSFLAEESELMDQPAKPVNLSAGGIALLATEEVGVGSFMEIKMLLPPAFTGILTYGEVVACDPSSEENYDYRLRINFSHIRDSDRDALIRHMLRRQGEYLRLRREQMER